MKKLLTITLSFLTIFTVLGFKNITTKERERKYINKYNEPVVIKLLDFIFEETYDEDVEVQYDYNTYKQTARVINKKGDILETFSVENTNPYTRNGEYDYTFSRDKTFGKDVIRLEIFTRLYKSGSFRELISIDGSDLYILTNESRARFESKNHFVYDKKDRITYNYSGILVTEVNTSESISVELDAALASFTAESTVGNTVYYRKYISDTGTIRFY